MATEYAPDTELEPRESTSSIERSLDLPSLVPLSHEHDLLSSAKFDVDAFLLSRIHIPLDELRGELRSYLAELREELVQLINDDYEEFISLGTGLRGEGERLKGLQGPLGGLRGEVEVVRDVLKEHQVAVQAKLDERASLREEKALLDLLQRLFETLGRAEALESGSVDERPRVVQRLANEYTQLVYLRDKAKREGCKIVDSISPRIDKLRTRLSTDLSALLTAALGSRDETQLKSCLRTYDVIEGWQEAEAVVRREFKTFCAKTITQTALHSPPPQPAPETPEAAGQRRARLEESSGKLGEVYNLVLAQVESYDSLLSIAHSVSPQFDIFAGVLWPEICNAVINNIGGTIFAAGRPNDLHKHYTTTYKFISLLEDHAPTPEAVLELRESPEYTSLERRWQLPVYFQLRWKEIVSSLETAFAAGAGASTSTWSLPQSGSTWEAFQRCWAPDVFLPELAHRFLRLSLQVVERYAGWLSSQLSTFKPGTDEDQSEDDAALRFAASAVADIDQLSERINDLATLSDLGIDLPLTLSTARYEDRIISILQRRCSEPLKFVRSVASELRAAPAKPSLTASRFIPSVLRPLHAFLDARPALKAYREPWSRAVIEHVLSQYASMLASVRKTEDLLRRHKKSKKSGFSLFGSSSAASSEQEQDGDERFRRQMRCDVDALAADAKTLSVQVDSLPAWKELLDVAERPAEGNQ